VKRRTEKVYTKVCKGRLNRGGRGGEGRNYDERKRRKIREIISGIYENDVSFYRAEPQLSVNQVDDDDDDDRDETTTTTTAITCRDSAEGWEEWEG